MSVVAVESYLQISEVNSSPYWKNKIDLIPNSDSYSAVSVRDPQNSVQAPAEKIVG